MITYDPSSPSVDLDMMIGLKFHLVQREKKNTVHTGQGKSIVCDQSKISSSSERKKSMHTGQ